jgi:hypothetical protein
VLDKRSYLNAFHAESAALAAAARLGAAATVPSCPDWTIAQLVGHLGEVYLSVSKNARNSHGEDVVQELEDLELSPEFDAWLRQVLRLELQPPSVIEWYQECADTDP